mmetsp:Transcript_15304/g.20176  ORF Transcript_15304/g.20176 Transcript_15304/m.20176 type:complete len:257 (+) Transcript_15304:92-862(+)
MSSYVAPTTANTGLGSVLSPQNVSEAGNFASQRAAEFKQNLNEGNWSLRVLALIGAMAMMSVSVLGILADLVRLNWIAVIFEIYCFLLGVVIIILEYGQQLSCFARMESGLYKNALFLKYVWGRGLLYFVAGTLELSQRTFIDICIGLYVSFIGILFILVGRSAASKMAEARRSSVTSEEMQEKFAIADMDGKGSLTVEQFAALTKNLGMDLTRREVESAFIQLDCDKSGRVSYETVMYWWNNEASETDDFQVVVM